MSTIGLRIRLIRAVWIALLCAWCSGCIVVPVRVPTKTISASGETGKKLDVEFIKVGTTTREEVGHKLGWVDTGVKDDKLFLGRWADSSWGVAWAAGGGYSGAGGWNRSWTAHNLVLDFDEKGVVQQMSVVLDKDIINTLSERISKDPSRSLDLSVPIEAPVEYIRPGKQFLGTLILSKDDFTFLEDRGTGSKVAHDFKTSPENISHLSMGSWVASDSSHPENVVVTIHFRQKTPAGSKLAVRVDMPTTMILLKYIRQTQSGSSFKEDFQPSKGPKVAV
jgi:hypothetical protein